jgi:NitT/TauT family transport system substrate-binding protein
LEHPVTCLAPHYVAEEILHAEGFTDVRFVKGSASTDVLTSGEVDISLSFIPLDVRRIAAGAPIVVLAGSHIGCVEVVGGEHVRSVSDLRGKTVAIERPGSAAHIFISMFAAYVGVDPQKDINWVNYPYSDWTRLLAERRIDAFMVGPPLALEMRHKKIGHVLLNSTTDKPWSQYFCCLIASHRDFVHNNPIATKRALRALIKAADVCALEPKRAARIVADRGLDRYEYSLQMLQEIPYGKWREFDPEDALRFYALRMRELGMITTSPQKIIARGTDWRFLNELKKELRA